MIPKQLRREEIKFCRIQYKTKKPFEKDWTKKPHTYKEISKFIPKENYGILCGYGSLVVIDCDNDALQNVISSLLPKTFRVKTGSGGTHNYFFIKGLNNKIILETENGIHLGEVQSNGTQVVGPGSIHPNGSRYEVLVDTEIKEIDQEKLMEIIKPFMKEIKDTEETAKWEGKEHSELDDLSVADIWGLSGLKKRGNEYYGEHPIHGSEGGMNFWVNPLKNIWHCFRHNSGGGPLSAIAVKEGILDCTDSRKGVLRGDKAIQAIEKAKSNYGLKQQEEIKEIIEHEDKLKIIWDDDLQNYEEEEKEWIVNKLIPNRSVCILTGKRGTLKTFITLLLGYSITSGIDFLGKYSSRQGGVIYIDKENGLSIMKKRTIMIKNGLGLNKPHLKIGFICFSQIKIDKLTDIEKLEELVKEHKPKLIIVDTYRRGISFDENDAGAVSELFVDILRPFVERNNLAILLVHHNRKSGQGSGDEMEEIRGSSDLANYADIILKTERRGETLILKQLKNRNAKEEEDQQIKVEFDEETNKMNMIYEGVFKKHSQADKCVELLSVWIAKTKKSQFKTKEAKEIAFKEGIKETNFKNALNSMQNMGVIENIGFGLYNVLNQQNR